QARCPDAAGVGIAAHVELTRTIERACNEPPVDQIARVMNLDAGEPLECRRRNVVVVIDANDRRVRIETAKNRIEDRVLHHSYAAATMLSGRRSRTSVHRRAAPIRSSAARPMKNGV